MQNNTHLLSTFTMPETGLLFRNLITAWGYDVDHLTDANKREIGANLARFMDKPEPYSREYVSNILAGRTGSVAVRSAIFGLLAITDGTRVEQVKTHPVECLTEHNVHPGALILVDSRLCRCGLHFIPRSWNQRWHSKDCPARKDAR